MENSNLAVVLTFRRPLKIYKGLALPVRSFAYMFPHKEKSRQILFFLQKRITSIVSPQQSKKNETLSTFVGYFHPKKSDV